MKKVALLGGSFDPVHLGHISLAKAALEHLDIDELWFLPTGMTPLKDRTLSPAGKRLGMLKTILDLDSRFKICIDEMKRPGISYTIDTLKNLKENHPDTEFYFIIGADQAHQIEKWKGAKELFDLATFVMAERNQDHIEEKAEKIQAAHMSGLNPSGCIEKQQDQSEFSLENLGSALKSSQKEKEKTREHKDQTVQQLEREFPGIYHSDKYSSRKEKEALEEVEINDFKFLRLPFEPIDVSSSEIRAGKKINYLMPSTRQYILDHELYLVDWVKSHLSPHRLAHSLSVANICVDLARVHHLDEHKAYLMGLFHDVCKDMEEEDLKAWMEALYPPEQIDAPALWHAYIGAEVVDRYYGISDEQIKNAIFNHTKGSSYDVYAMILFIADKTDPLRGYDSSGFIQGAKENLYMGFNLLKRENKEFLKKTGVVR